MSLVYLLVSTNNITYVGVTNDLNHRLKQHNCEIKGGAKSTLIQVKQGYKWNVLAYITNFPDKSAALQFEWQWKYLSRKQSSILNNIEKRFNALYEIIKSDKSTKKSIPFSQWDDKICVIISDPKYNDYYSNLNN